jgi:Ni/Co efflux regulator RcnB
MRILIMSLTALAVSAAAVPLQAEPHANDRVDREYVDRGELRGDRHRVDDERRDLDQAYRYGSVRQIKNERHDLKHAEKEYRKDARDWQRGRSYSYNRPDPRYNGYYADNYYRGGGNYRPRRLGPDERIYRGRDNRYYCRRGDGTTGLIIGAVGGGVLGNVIAPGGSKTLGTLLGGGIGAIIGNSIGQGNVTCR